MRRFIAVVPLVLAFIFGCAEQSVLMPAPTAVPVDHLAGAAQDTAHGVRVVIRTDAWRGVPQPLDAVIPIEVTIHNGSTHALRIRYREVSLVGADGMRLRALPPLRIRGTEIVEQPVAQNDVTLTDVSDHRGPEQGERGEEEEEEHHHHGDGHFFIVAPYGPYFPGNDLWDGPFDYDYDYYGTYYTQWPVQLPTSDMIRSAMPEGVLDVDGTTSGFVYFPTLAPGVHGATFTLKLVDADSKQPFGTVQIPLVHR